MARVGEREEGKERSRAFPGIVRTELLLGAPLKAAMVLSQRLWEDRGYHSLWGVAQYFCWGTAALFLEPGALSLRSPLPTSHEILAEKIQIFPHGHHLVGRGQSSPQLK